MWKHKNRPFAYIPVSLANRLRLGTRSDADHKQNHKIKRQDHHVQPQHPQISSAVAQALAGMRQRQEPNESFEQPGHLFQREKRAT